MKLIIGKNSSIVRKIEGSLKNFHIISHKDIKSVDLSSYTKIFLFSWDKKTTVRKNTLNILNTIPPEKLYFISTTAIYSIDVRSQWNKYPIFKKNAEDHVKKINGKIIRFGILESDQEKIKNYDAPITYFEDISCLLNNDKELEKIDPEYNLIKIRRSKSKNKTLQEFLYKTTHVFNFLPYRMFIEIITKLTGSLFYGFTADMLQSFSDKSLLGFGVLGSEYYKKNDSKIKVIASNEKDQMLENNGFVNTYIGKDKTGLAKLWRGTRIIKKDGKIFKTVPFYLKRPKVIRHAIISDIKKITFNELFFEIILGDGRTIFSNELVFACGPLENTRLLSSIIDYKEPCYLSDHEIFNLGVVSKLAPIRSGFIKKFGPFAIRRNLLEVNNIKQKTVVEFKPFSEEHFKGEGNKIYFDTTPNIILKLLRSFSLSRINEAFFTKFGFGFLTNKFIIFCQTLNKDCIKYDPIKGSFTKQRLNEADFHQISNEIEAKIGKFEKIFPTETIDGQHAMGASSIFKNQYLQDLIKEKKITILGSPTSLQLDHLHHTSIFIDKIKEKKL